MADYDDQEWVPASTGVVYAEAKALKTSMLIAAFPNGLFIGARPAIELVAQAEYGFTPTVWPWSVSDTETIADIEDVPARIEVLAHLMEVLQFLDEEGYADVFGAVINDDLTPIVKRSIRWWVLEEKRTRSGNIDDYYQWQQLDGFMVDVAGQCRYMGCHCWSSAWRRAKTFNKKKGVWYPGGPDIGSAAQSSSLPGWFDTNVRSLLDDSYPDPWVKRCLWADVRSSDWRTGDRNSIAINGRRIPPNIRELLLASQTPYRLERLDGCEWQDELADEIAEAVVTYGSRSTEVWDVISNAFGGDVPEAPRTSEEAFIRWGLQDGIARGVLRRLLGEAMIDRDAWLAGAAGAAVVVGGEDREDGGTPSTTSSPTGGGRRKRPTPPPLEK